MVAGAEGLRPTAAQFGVRTRRANPTAGRLMRMHTSRGDRASRPPGGGSRGLALARPPQRAPEEGLPPPQPRASAPQPTAAGARPRRKTVHHIRCRAARGPGKRRAHEACRRLQPAAASARQEQRHQQSGKFHQPPGVQRAGEFCTSPGYACNERQLHEAGPVVSRDFRGRRSTRSRYRDVWHREALLPPHETG